ncbi:FAD binding domain-containing protein [Aridibaculum aurantiacum]|uniref:FAD binding domain-containing protein n=1 Tax=Aridibaculum aurantiacum TaxID=2810307 RepID=UPI001A97388F|nr:xanthine dehydrogenase family protein subunit M [Aridibaculum aurantiacum]
MIQFSYIKPLSQRAAIDALRKDPTAQFIAGGTNLVDLMKRGVSAPQKLIDINALPLKQIAQQEGKINIGALALNGAVSEHPLIVSKLPLLSLALQAGASAQLRNMATVGGNMMQRTRCPYFYETSLPCNKREPGSGCSALEGYNRMHAIFGHSNSCIAVHPSDMSVAMAALNATVLVEGPKGKRAIPFTDFHKLPGDTPQKDNTLQPGELIVGVNVPEQPFTKHVHYLKIRDRASYAFALVSVAAALHLDGKTIKDARLAMGGVAHKPWRLADAEKHLVGKRATEETFLQAAEIAMQGAKAFKHNAFKIPMGKNAIVEALKTAAAKT